MLRDETEAHKDAHKAKGVNIMPRRHNNCADTVSHTVGFDNISVVIFAEMSCVCFFRTQTVWWLSRSPDPELLMASLETLYLSPRWSSKTHLLTPSTADLKHN